MKLTVFLILLSFVQLLANNSYAQKTKLTVDLNNTSIEMVLLNIENQSNFKFIYNKEKVDVDSRVSLQIKEKSINETLDALFEGKDVSYTFYKNQVILTNKSETKSAPNAQQKPVSGKVTDYSGSPLPGVSVVIKGTTQGVITDPNGNFSLSNVPENATLQFSFVGMKGQEVDVAGKTTVNVKMVEDAIGIEEVVAVGYGTMKKSDITGSVSSIKSDKLKRQPLSSLDQGISGLAPGLQVTQGGGSPGGGTSIRIRGGNSLLGGNEPLYVIDGFPIYADADETVPGGGAGGGGASVSPLAAINPSDIESIEILKDASATAIYGSRGANGVIIVTTKQGTRGKINVNYEGFYGIQETARKIELMNGEQMASFHNVYAVNDGKKPVFDGVILPKPEDIGEGTDWQDQIFRAAPIQNHNLSISGGDQKTIYNLSVNRYTQEGIVKSTGYNRSSIRLNLEHSIGRFRVGSYLFYSRNERIGDQSETTFDGARGAVHAALSFNPALPVFRQDGTYSENSDIPLFSSAIENPLRIVNEWQDKTEISRILSNVFAEVEILKGLKFKSSLGINDFSADRNVYIPKTTMDARNVRGDARQSKNRSFNYVTENVVTFNKSFSDQHSINAVAGFTYQEQVSTSLFASATGFVVDAFGYNNLGAGDTPKPSSSGKSQWQMASWLARINYSLMNKYIFTFTGRTDGSSKFGENNKWAVFPSGAFAWRLNNEPFVHSLDFFDNLKVRISYGLTGNSEIGSYQSLSRLNTASYTFNNALTIGFVPANIPNPNLRWETTSILDIGADIGILNNKLRFTADYYYKKTTDLLLNRSIPNSSGFNSALDNKGSIENKGIEFDLNADIIDRAFKWTFSGNISANRNKILDLGDSESFTTGTITSSGFIKTTEGSYVKVGEPVGVYLVLINDGIFQNQEQLDAGPEYKGFHKLGYPRYIDTDGSGTIDDNDRQVFGNPNPDFIFGFTNSFSWRGFDLSFVISGMQNYYVLNLLRARGARVRPNEAQFIEIADYWTPENTDTDIPKAENSNFERFSSRNFEDGSHWRIKNLTFGYNIPSNTVKYLKNARVYLSIQNLYIHTGYTGFDPDVNSGSDNGGVTDNFNRATDRAAYPSARTYTLGINLGF